MDNCECCVWNLQFDYYVGGGGMNFVDVVILIVVFGIMGLILWKKFFSKKKKSHCETCPYHDCNKKSQL